MTDSSQRGNVVQLNREVLRPTELSPSVLLSLWSAVVNSTDDAVICKTLDGRIVAWNAGATRLFGYEPNEIIGRPVATLIPPELQHQEDDIVAKLRRGERIEHYETIRLTKDGRRVEVSLTVSPVRDANGEVIAASKIAREIGTLRHAERARAQLSAIVDSSDDAIVSKTLQGIIQSWNVGAARVFGYTSEEAVGKSILMLIPPELRHEEDVILERIRRGERVEHFDTVRVTKDGRRIPISLTVSPVRDSRGQIIGASKIARDISERKRAEEILAAEAAELAQLNEFGSRLWRCRQINEGLAEILDAVIALMGADKGNVQLLSSADQLLRIEAQSGFQPEFLEHFKVVSATDDSACGRALRRGERSIIEDVELDKEYAPLRSIARNASFRAVISTPLIGVDGQTLGVVSTHFAKPHNPTVQQLRRLDLYVRQACDFIERCKIEGRLRQSENALKEADRRKDEFLALLAHELRNPLAPIRYASAIGTQPTATAEQRQQAMEMVNRQASHMARLLDDLLDVSRITLGKLELKFATVDLRTVLAVAVETARPLIDEKRHDLSVELPPGPILLCADQVRLAQVFSNLLLNAARYTNVGGRIALRASLDDDHVSIRVIDNGVGIPSTLLPKLFAIFTQAEGSAGRTSGGLGVGLFLAQGLVSLHGGTIMASSAGENAGAEFVVRLPFRRTPDPVASDDRRNKDVNARPLSILVVDDNEDAAVSCKVLLELRGHQVHVAHAGERGFALAEQRRPDVLLLDIGLPDMSGYELAQRIRMAPWGHQAVLVAVTGWGQDEDKRRAFDSGFNYHLTKPVDSEALMAMLTSIASSRMPK